jgi:hypothetical protein
MFAVILDLSPYLGSSHDLLVSWFCETPKTPALYARIRQLATTWDRSREDYTWVDVCRDLPLDELVFLYEAWTDTVVPVECKMSIEAVFMYLIEVGEIRMRDDRPHLAVLVCDSTASMRSGMTPLPSKQHRRALLGTTTVPINTLIDTICRSTTSAGSLSAEWSIDLVEMGLLTSRAHAICLIEAVPTIEFARVFLARYERDDVINPFISCMFNIYTNNSDKVWNILTYYMAALSKGDIRVRVRQSGLNYRYTFVHSALQLVIMEDMMMSRNGPPPYISHIEVAAKHREILFKHYTYLHLIPTNVVQTPEMSLLRRARYLPSLRSQLPVSRASRLELVFRVAGTHLARVKTLPYLPEEMWVHIFSYVVLDENKTYHF